MFLLICCTYHVELAQSLFEQTVNSCCLVAKQHHTNVTKAKKMTKIKCVSK